MISYGTKVVHEVWQFKHPLSSLLSCLTSWNAVLSRVSCLIAALGICKGRTIKPAVGAGCVPEHGYALSRPESLSWKLSKWNSVKFDPEYDC